MNRQDCQIRGFRQVGFRFTCRCLDGKKQCSTAVCKMQRTQTQAKAQGHNVTSALQAGDGLTME